MIHMLSRFDLKDGIDIEVFAKAYETLAFAMKARGMIAGTMALGCRLADTPMDTDKPNAPNFYSVMTFRDRVQLDEAYAYLLKPPEVGDELDAHNYVKWASKAPVFTCWQDLT